MSSLKIQSRLVASIAVDIAREWHQVQEVTQEVELAIAALLKAKTCLMRAHHKLYGEEPTSGVA